MLQLIRSIKLYQSINEYGIVYINQTEFPTKEAHHMRVDRSKWISVRVESMSYRELCRDGIILWAAENIEGGWTMSNQTTFLFEKGEDAMMFRLTHQL